MKIEWAKNKVEGVEKGKKLFASNNIRLSSTEEVITVGLDDKRTIYFEGEFFYCYRPGVRVTYLKKDSGLVEKLADVFRNNTISNAVSCLEGEYIGVLVDEKEGIVKLFSDILGKVNVYWAEKENDLIVSTNLEDVVSFFDGLDYDQIALMMQLTLNYTPKLHTFYKQIRRLGVGESMVLGSNRYSIEKHKTEILPIRKYDENDLESYWNIFQDAVYSRASDKLNWVTASGGWDSTSLTAMLLKEFDSKKVRSILGEMKYSEKTGTYNPFEVEKVKRTSDFFGIEYDIVPFVVDRDMVDYWVKHAPFFKKNYVYYWLFIPKLWDFITENHSISGAVVYHGDISDSIHNFGFSQYATIIHDSADFSEYADKMNCYLYSPSFFSKVKKGTFKDDFVYRFFKQLKGEENFDDSDTDRDLFMKKYFLPIILWGARIPFYNSFGSANFFTKEAKEELFSWIFDNYVGNLVDQMNETNLYAIFMEAYKSIHFQGTNRTMFPTSLSANGIPCAQPFYDSRMIDFTAAMPESWGRGLEFNNVKYPLKWVLRNKVKFPLDIIGKSPHSYVFEVTDSHSPTGDIIYNSGMKDYIKDVMSTRSYKEIMSDEYFDFKYIDRMIDKYLKDEELGEDEGFFSRLFMLMSIGWY